MYEGEVYLHDTKTATRDRTVPITDELCRELLALAKGKSPQDPVFSLDYLSLDYVWQQVREKAGLQEVRFKDLSAQAAIYAASAGVPQATIQSVLGHSSPAMTLRYQKHKAVMTTGQAANIEKELMAAVNAQT